MPTVAGTALEMKAKGIDESRFNALMAMARGGARRSAKESGRSIAIEGDYSQGYIKILMDEMDKQSVAVQKMLDYFNNSSWLSQKQSDGTYKTHGQFTARSANILSRKYDGLKDNRALAAIDRIAKTNAIDVDRDRGSNTLSVMLEKDPPGGLMGRAGAVKIADDISKQVGHGRRRDKEAADNRKLYSAIFQDQGLAGLKREEQAAQAALLAAPNSKHKAEYLAKLQRVVNRKQKEDLREKEGKPGTAEWNAKIFGGLNARSKAYQARLAWAKKNKGDPIADGIIRSDRNKTAGGRMINKMKKLAKFGIVAGIMKLISAGIGVMIGFLKSLPQMAKDVNNLASRGAKFNLSEMKLKEYDKLAEFAFGDKESGREVISGFLGQIHTKAGSIINGDVNSVLGPMAALSAAAGGKATDTLIKYFTKDPNVGVDDVMLQAANDVMLLTFQSRTATGGAASIDDAFETNIADLEAAYGSKAAEFVTEIFRVWKNTKVPFRDNVMADTLSGKGDFVTIMKGLFNTFKGGDIATGVDEGRAQKRADEINKLKADVSAVKDGLLKKILGSLEPVVAYLRQILRALLNFAASIAPWSGAGAARDAMDQQTMVENQGKRQVTEIMKLRTKQDLDYARKEYGFENDTVWANFINAVDRGQHPVVMYKGKKLPLEEVITLRNKQTSYDHAVKTMAQFFDEDIAKGCRPATGAGLEDYAAAAQAVAFAAIENNKTNVQNAIESGFEVSSIRELAVERAEEFKARLDKAEDEGVSWYDSANPFLPFDPSTFEVTANKAGVKTYRPAKWPLGFLPESIINFPLLQNLLTRSPAEGGEPYAYNPVTKHKVYSIEDLKASTDVFIDNTNTWDEAAAAFEGKSGNELNMVYRMSANQTANTVGGMEALNSILRYELDNIIASAGADAGKLITQGLLTSVHVNVDVTNGQHTFYLKDPASGKTLGAPVTVEMAVSEKDITSGIKKLPFLQYLITENEQK